MFGTLSKQFSAGLSKLRCTRAVKHFGEIFFEGKSLCSLRTLRKIFVDLRWKLSLGILEIALYESIGTFWDVKKNLNIYTLRWQILGKRST